MTTQLFIYNEALGHLGERLGLALGEPRAEVPIPLEAARCSGMMSPVIPR
jgi:hypothetical protein